MIYDDTTKNLMIILEEAKSLDVEQLRRFFAGCTFDGDTLEYKLQRLHKERIIIYDEEFERVQLRCREKMKAYVTEAYVRAFWVICAYRVDEVREIRRLTYPGQFYFILEDNTSYDVSVVTSKQDAAISLRELRWFEKPGAEDFVTHIALVTNEKLGAEIKDIGFDCYCILDPDHRPRYYEC